MKYVLSVLFVALGVGCTERSADEIQTSAWAYVLSEIHEVVLLEKFTDKSEFRARLENLRQGASLEGVYNSLTHSSSYRELEQGSGKSNLEALEQFISYMVNIQGKLSRPSKFYKSSGKPLAVPTMPESSMQTEKSIGRGVTELTFSDSSKKYVQSKDPKTLQGAFLEYFSESSVFTLKRVIGDEILKLIEDLKIDRKKLAAWYGSFAKTTLNHKIDFGLPLRNKDDESFHKQWAEKIDLDTLRWEALNRIHRILNHYAKLKVGAG